MTEDFKTIPLTKGYSAIVDAEDYEWLMRWKWHVCECTTVYAMRNSKPDADGRRHHIMMHREIAKTPKGMETDFKNGDGLDNRKENLRNCTRSQNQHNRNPNKRGASKYKGVYRMGKKWAASLQIDKKRIFLGTFVDEKAAGAAYAFRAQIEFKEFNKEIKYG